LEHGVDEENIFIRRVPGTFEIPYAASLFLNEERYRFGAIIAIGCVIRGETPHFDYICSGVSNALAYLNAKGRTPVIFSVLTTNNRQEALERAGGSLGNKGIEGAYTALKMTYL